MLKYAPELDKRIRPHLQSTNDSWQVDETYIKAECRRGNLPPFPFLLVKGQWKYLYRAVDSEGNALDFLLKSETRCNDIERFLRKTLNVSHTQSPRVINVDKNAAYPKAFETLKGDETRLRGNPAAVEKILERQTSLNKRNRPIKRLVNAGMGNKIVQHSTPHVEGI